MQRENVDLLLLGICEFRVTLNVGMKVGDKCQSNVRLIVAEEAAPAQAMELHSSSRPRRALIVEDEIVIALDLQDAMSAMGFDQCDLASNDRNARSLAMESQPDVALVDVCLWREGARG